MNNFKVTGYVCKDAEVTNFKKAAIARFGIIVDEYEQLTFLQTRAYSKLGNRSLSTLVAYISVA